MKHPFAAIAGLLTLVVSIAQAGPVNVNSATADVLAAELSGVGLAKAQLIVDYRRQHGPFKSADELALVKGIGEKTLAKNRENILLKD